VIQPDMALGLLEAGLNSLVATADPHPGSQGCPDRREDARLIFDSGLIRSPVKQLLIEFIAERGTRLDGPRPVCCSSGCDDQAGTVPSKRRTVGGSATPTAWKTLLQVPRASLRSRKRWL
jgi:hypothetical protein